MRDGNVKRRLILEAEDCCIPTLTPPADRRRAKLRVINLKSMC